MEQLAKHVCLSLKLYSRFSLEKFVSMAFCFKKCRNANEKRKLKLLKLPNSLKGMNRCSVIFHRNSNNSQTIRNKLHLIQIYAPFFFFYKEIVNDSADVLQILVRLPRFAFNSIENLYSTKITLRQLKSNIGKNFLN